MSALKSLLKSCLPRGVAPRKILRGPAAGLTIELDLSQDTQVWLGRYEREVLEWTVRRVPAGGLCLDVGAADGLFSLLLARAAGRCGRVIAIEPRADHLRRAIKLNADRPFAPIDVCEGLAGDGSAGSYSVDTLVQKAHQPLAFAKIDVDGAESLVLEGMRDTLARDRPPIALELHSPELRDACVGLLESIGYRCEIRFPAPHEHRPLEYNTHLFAEAR